MKRKQWDEYVRYLCEYNKHTDWVHREPDEDIEFPDYDLADPREYVDIKLIKERFREILEDHLEERYLKVIIERFGLDDDRPKTLREVGEILGRKQERIRLYQSKAFRILRQPKIACLFFDLFEYLEKHYEEEKKRKQEEINSNDTFRKEYHQEDYTHENIWTILHF